MIVNFIKKQKNVFKVLNPYEYEIDKNQKKSN